MRRFFLLPLLALLAACSIELPQVDPDFHGLPDNADPAHFECCWTPERHPAALVELSLALSPLVVPLAPDNLKPERPGRLTGKTAAQAEIVRRLRPLDIVLMANKTVLGGRLIPGRFTHSAVYLGTEAQLRAIGLWNTPAFVPLHDQIHAGKLFIEAYRPVVRLQSPRKLFETDSVLLIRPELTLAERRAAAQTLVGKLGVPFDWWFDNTTPDTLACTELIEVAMPWLHFTVRAPYGRPAVMPDDMAAKAIRGEQMHVLAHIRGNEGPGYAVESYRGAMYDIAAFWGPKPKEAAQ